MQPCVHAANLRLSSSFGYTERPNWSRMHNGAVGLPAVDLLKIAMLCQDSKKIKEFALEEFF